MYVYDTGCIYIHGMIYMYICIHYTPFGMFMYTNIYIYIFLTIYIYFNHKKIYIYILF